jgi:hypothetical protein
LYISQALFFYQNKKSSETKSFKIVFRLNFPYSNISLGLVARTASSHQGGPGSNPDGYKNFILITYFLFFEDLGKDIYVTLFAKTR